MKISITIDGLSPADAHDLLGMARQIEQAAAQRSDADQQAAFEHETGHTTEDLAKMKRELDAHGLDAPPSPEQETPNETVDDTPAPRRRRRPPVDTGDESRTAEGNDNSQSALPATEATPVGENTGASPKTRRKRATKAEMAERRRLEAEAEDNVADGGSDDTVGDGRGDTGEAQELTDADMSKAASEGARRIGPEAVTAILSEFGVGSVNELPQERRQEFVDNVDAAKAEAGESE